MNLHVHITCTVSGVFNHTESPPPPPVQLEHPGSLHCDPRNAYYLVDPGNSLDRTRERFGPWFSNERGWQGLAGSSPTQEELLTALQQCSLYM